MCIIILLLSSALKRITKMIITDAVVSVTSCSFVLEVFLSKIVHLNLALI